MAMCFKSPFHPAHIPILTLLIHTTTVFFDLHLELQWRSWSLEDRFRNGLCLSLYVVNLMALIYCPVIQCCSNVILIGASE
ncbi:hypothetical protein SDJN02_12249, partial [Cucurbita argyrosperma subsp. argyrosperma]